MQSCTPCVRDNPVLNPGYIPLPEPLALTLGLHQSSKSATTTPQAELDAEHWCGVLQEVALPDTGGEPAAFMAKAVDFANERCEGTLSCSIFVPPQVSVTDYAVAELCGSFCSASHNLLTRCACSQRANNVG